MVGPLKKRPILSKTASLHHSVSPDELTSATPLSIALPLPAPLHKARSKTPDPRPRPRPYKSAKKKRESIVKSSSKEESPEIVSNSNSPRRRSRRSVYNKKRSFANLVFADDSDISDSPLPQLTETSEIPKIIPTATRSSRSLLKLRMPWKYGYFLTNYFILKKKNTFIWVFFFFWPCHSLIDFCFFSSFF